MAILSGLVALAEFAFQLVVTVGLFYLLFKISVTLDRIERLLKEKKK